MKNFDLALEDFWQARNAGPYPTRWEAVMSAEDACRINLALIERHAAQGNKQVGWKVGLTSRAIREQFGLPEPVFAVLYEKGRWPSGREWPLDGLVNPGWENELCLSLAKTLRGPDISLEAARDAIAGVAPALEIIETRGPNALEGFNTMLADNGQQRAFVVGEESEFDPARHDLGQTSVEVFIDGEKQDEAFGSAVMGSGPVASIQWLANQLARYERTLAAGQVVMTGSFTRQFAIERPLAAEARFDPFGSATATFV
ncbi:MAG: 2-keto-4-pentenoate hydratase [Alphaproteobacteria bacterium]